VVAEIALSHRTRRRQAERVRVYAGGAELQVVCGATMPGGTAQCLAMVGARLPGIEHRQGDLRGVESQGMLCSALSWAFRS